MEIIPVIDIQGGKVVRATGGNRMHYPLLTSLLTKNTEPLAVIKDFLEWYPFTKVYIADLDAIKTGVNNYFLYDGIAQSFPQLEFWIDAGIRTYNCWQKFDDYLTISPVIGSESLVESEWLLSEEIRTRGILSLDFHKGKFLGLPKLLQQTTGWTNRIIVMELDNVGEKQGPNIDHLLELKNTVQHSQWVAAGGIRNMHDLTMLSFHGVKQALLASALHDGIISQQDLRQMNDA